jgi:hypothetical protein
MESGMMDSLERTSAHELQRQIQSLILATDIARQQDFLSAFQVLVFIFSHFLLFNATALSNCSL